MNNPNQNQDNSQFDPRFEEAMRNFRLSLHTWSEHELTSRPAMQMQSARSAWHWFTAPAATWAAAAALAIVAVGVPVGVHHHNVVIAQQKAADEAREHKLQEIQAATQTQIAHTSIDDDKLLQYVDTDIAQDTPDAMQPLASLMSESGAE
jgi:hypothetical protein